MAWIQVEAALVNHPKLKRMARALECSRQEALGTVTMIWLWAMDYAKDGHLTAEYEPEDLADGIGYAGTADLFDALTYAGFLDEDGRLHDWHEYGGKLHAQRERDAARKRAERAVVENSGSRKSTPAARSTSSRGNAGNKGTSGGRPADGAGTSGARKEKKRIEKKRPSRAHAREDGVVENLLEELMGIWPRPGDPAEAEPALVELVEAGEDPERILEAARRAAPAMRERELRFVPYLSTWVLKGSWRETAPAENEPRPEMVEHIAGELLAGRLEDEAAACMCNSTAEWEAVLATVEATREKDGGE